MPEETKKPGIFGARSGQGNTTDKPAAEVSEAEAAALQGAGGPNRSPAFTKRDGQDENVQLTNDDDLAEAKKGAAASSAPPGLDMNAIEAAAAAGTEVAEGHEDTTQYTSTPIAALKIGRFQFENGVLRLKNGKDVEEFEKLLAQGSIRTQQVVRKIDRSAGEVVARRYLEQNKSQSRSGVDTADRGPRAPVPGEGQPAPAE